MWECPGLGCSQLAARRIDDSSVLRRARVVGVGIVEGVVQATALMPQKCTPNDQFCDIRKVPEFQDIRGHVVIEIVLPDLSPEILDPAEGALAETGDRSGAVSAFESGLQRAEGAIRLALTKGLQKAKAMRQPLGRPPQPQKKTKEASAATP